MDLLRDWLAPTIWDELSQALQWKEESLHHDQRYASTSTSFIDDGSNFRIRMSTTGVVQIHKFLTFVEPIRATLADQSTRVNATISRSAIRKYEEVKRKPFTQETTGGLIQILQFEIVATDIGPRTDRLTLFVEQFTSLGSDGSAVNDIPRPIESPDKQCFDLHEKLMEARKSRKTNGNRRSSTRESSAAPSSIQSQTALTNSNEEFPDSQSGFMTQIPAVKNIRAKPQHSSISFDSANYERRADVNFQVGGFEIKQPVNGGDNTTRRGLIESEANCVDSSAGMLQDSRDHSMPNLMNRTTTVADEGRTTAITVKDATSVNGHENIDLAETNQNHGFLKDHVIGRNLEILDASQRPRQLLSQLLHRSSKKRKLNDRISGHDVRIPRDQEMLLSRQDSWLPPEPGQKEPRAHIPIQLLQTFNEDADSRQRIETSMQEDFHTSTIVDREENSDGTQATESDSDIASAQWPPSPNRHELPPDSSPPDIGQADAHLNDRGLSIHPSPSTILDQATSQIVSVSPSDEIDIQLTEKNDASHAEGGKLHPNSLPPANLVESAQLTSEETLQGQMKGLVDNSTKLHHLQNQEHSENISKSGNQPKIDAPDLEIIHSSNSLPDSDIEMTVPTSLYQSAKSTVVPHYMENPPSTAPSSKHPFTQIKRTPYNGLGHSDSNGSFVNSWRVKLNGGSERINNMVEEGSTQIPCTTSTCFFNSEDPTNSSSTTRKSLIDVDPISPQRNSTRKEEASNTPPMVANENSTTGYDHGPSHEILHAKRLLQRKDDPIDSSPDSKRQKTEPNPINAHLSSQRRMSVKSPVVDMVAAPQISPSAAKPASQHSPRASPLRNGDTTDPKGVSVDYSAQSDLTKPKKFDNIQNMYFNDGDIENSNKAKNNAATPPSFETASLNQNNDHSNGYLAKLDIHSDEQTIDISEAPRANRVPKQTNLNRSGFSKVGGQNASPIMEFPKAAEPQLGTQSVSFNTEIATSADASALPDTDHHDHHRLSQSNTHKELRSKTPQISHGTANGIPSPHHSGKAQPINTSFPQTLFDLFKSSYPEYNGDIKHFRSLCNKISRLERQDSLHQSLWDDFLLRSKIEYAHHIQNCMENGEDPLPYEKFYNEEIDEPRYRKRVLTRSILKEVLHGDRARSITSLPASIASTPVKRNFAAVSPDLASQKGNDVRKDANPAITIDLTEEDVDNENVVKQDNVKSSKSKSPSRRQLPWPTDSHGPETSNSDGEDTTLSKQHHLSLVKQLKPRSKDGYSSHKRPGLDPQSNKSGETIPKSANVEALGPRPHESRPSLWWQDENTPFKKFMRSYLAIRPGKGNTFAKPEDVARGREEDQRHEVRGLEDLDFQNWRI